MSGSLRDQLLGLGFKAEPRPAPKKPEGRERSASNRPEHRGDRRDHRGDRAQPGKSSPKPAHAHAHAPSKRSHEMDLAKAYAIRAQKEKDERIAAERERQAEAERKREGKLKLADLLKTATLNDPKAEVARHFEYGGKIRRVYVTPEQLIAVNAGELGVVQQGGRYHLVSVENARAANELLPGVLALLVDPNAPREEEAYSDPQYQVPDDLVW